MFEISNDLILAQRCRKGAVHPNTLPYALADFSGAFIQAVAPVVSIVSSGDESARKENIHPRATLMSALGRWSQVAEPLVFVTELVAFFNVEGQATLTAKRKAEE